MSQNMGRIVLLIFLFYLYVFNSRNQLKTDVESQSVPQQTTSTDIYLCTINMYESESRKNMIPFFFSMTPGIQFLASRSLYLVSLVGWQTWKPLDHVQAENIACFFWVAWVGLEPTPEWVQIIKSQFSLNHSTMSAAWNSYSLHINIDVCVYIKKFS